MSLYYETAAILENPDKIGGSFKARIFKKKDLKSKPGQIYALVAEASKWSRVLKDVIEKCAVLKEERKLTPILALLLTHDLLLSKSGVAAHKDHVLRLAIERHKARLAAELTKARIRYKFPTLDAFRAAVNAGDLDVDDAEGETIAHPRWLRVNTIKSSLEAQMESTFKGYESVASIGEILRARGSRKIYYQDPNIPNLLALPGRVDLSKTPGYVKGEIIFQDKASCFPAYLLDLKECDGHVIDGCAAPGNKTTHAAAIVSSLNSGAQGKVIAFERDKGRSEILKKMVRLAGADDIVTVKGASDFIAAKPGSPEYENVGAILLDPSCSGTGIVGRDDAIKLHLPSASAETAKLQTGNPKSKKRKRDSKPPPAEPQDKGELTLDLDDTTQEEVPLDAADKLIERLTALSTFQLHILTHAMRFPAARKITYSTCSIHFEENEGVVFQALATSVAKERGWRVLRREEQVEGLRKWRRRGEWEEGKLSGAVLVDGNERDEVLEGCIRCDKGTEEGTMGFFVAAFVREGEDGEWSEPQQRKKNRGREEVDLMDVNVREPAAPTAEQDGDDEEEWDGFSDNEGAADLKAKAEAAVVRQEEEAKAVPATATRGKKGKTKKRKTGNNGVVNTASFLLVLSSYKRSVTSITLAIALYVSSPSSISQSPCVGHVLLEPTPISSLSPAMRRQEGPFSCISPKSAKSRALAQKMDDQTSTYTYTPLDASKRQIRLLHLLPATSTRDSKACDDHGNDIARPASGPQNNGSDQGDIKYTVEIHCTFSLVSLDDALEYEALSYFWGDQTDLTTIFLDGHPVLITRNLYDALFHMRQTKERTVWADALCINQKDMAERASQVLQMNSIYGQASTVVIYLGAMKDAGVTFRFVEALCVEPLKHYYDAASMYATIQSFGLDLDSDTARRYLVELFSLPWWGRVWTVQEYVLAKTAVFQSGGHLLMGIYMKGLSESFLKHSSCCSRGGRFENSWLPIRDLKTGEVLAKALSLLAFAAWEGKSEQHPLLTAAYFRNRQCSNPLDKLYGVLGLADPASQSQIRPDYNSTPRIAYTRATMGWISESRVLDILSCVHGERSDSLNIPTYVPDLSIPTSLQSTHLTLERHDAMESFFHAAQDSEARVSLCPSFEVTTHAIFMDNILKTVDEETVSSWGTMDEEREHTCSSNNNSNNNSDMLTRYVPLLRACWQTICGGILPRVVSDDVDEGFRLVQDNDYAVFQKWCSWDEGMTSDAEALAFNSAATMAQEGRNFAITNTGYIGLIPEKAKPGDHLVLMPGGKVPYILRRVRESKKRRHWKKRNAVRRYEFIGDCYIHGIMHGEAWDESKLQKIILV
ncbi:nol1 nop2 sun family protein [Stagonosporopsis vannaccii]|nr:nol1 nop2 sun family protein [Stagonosporopsis vannaccii]